MVRLPYPDTEAGARSHIAEEVRQTRGELLNLFRALLHAPTVAEPWLRLGTALRYRTGLDDRVRELAICQVARLTGSAYEWHHHAPPAARAGVSEDQLAALPDWRGTAAFEGDDAELLAFVEAVVAGDVDDARFHAVSERLGAEATVELTATVAFYVAVSRFLSALDVDIEAPG